CAVITLSASVFKGDYFFVLALLNNLSGDLRAGNQRIAMGEIFSVCVKQYFAERSRFTWIKVEKINVQRFAFRDAILSSACFDNCVGHGCFPGRKSREKSHRTSCLTRGKLCRRATR